MRRSAGEIEQLGGGNDELFRTIAEESPNMIFVSRNDRIVYVNRIGVEVTGYSREEFLSPGFHFFNIVADECLENVKSNYEKQVRNMEVESHDCVLKTKDGRRIEFILTMRLMEYQGEKAVLGILTDISQLKAFESALMESEKKYRTTVDFLNDAIIVVGQDMRVILANDACKNLALRSGGSSDFEGKTLCEAFPFFPSKVIDEYRQVFSDGKALAIESAETVNEQTIYTERRRIPILENGKVVKVIGILRDITDRKKIELELKSVNDQLRRSNKKLKGLVVTDPLTGLYNHRYLGEVLDKAFVRAKRFGEEMSLLMLDLDYFKSVNDVYGHPFGDIVLKQFSLLLKKIVRSSNSIIRYGGEEFVIVAPDTGKKGVMKLARRILDTINVSRFGDKNKMINLKISIAVLSFPDDGVVKSMDMIRIIEQILGKTKESGGNRIFCLQDMKTEPEKSEQTDIAYLKEKMERLHKQANEGLIEAIFAFAKTIEMKDHCTGEHVERTVYIANKIAEALGLTKDEVLRIKQAAILHDLGKVGISEQILQKPSKLTKKEFKEIQRHPQIGVDIIRPIHLLHDVVPLIMYHHERWDGKGYPEGLKGEEIPVGARIIALADTYQALTSNRPYRKAFSKKEAMKIIERLAGSQFEPKITETFLNIFKYSSK